MRRARKRSVILVALAALAWPASAQAFHAGNVFDKPPGAGGGGGIFYTGAAKERGWNCTACHTDAPGTIRVTLAADPPELLQSFRYEPGKTYSLTATLDGEHEGLSAGAANFNSLAVAFVAPDGSAAGSLGGYAADDFYSGETTLVSAGQHPGRTKWTFQWTAPMQGDVPVRVHMAAVDGDGAGSTGGGTLTDPWGDDVFVGALDLDSTRTASREERHDVRFATLGLVLFFGLRRRLSGGRR